jgi:sulfur relay (sulfurtransferase) DsrF/TusC family protein
MTNAFLRLAEDMEIELYVVESDLDKIGIDKNLIEPNIEIISDDHLASKLSSSDIVLNF